MDEFAEGIPRAGGPDIPFGSIDEFISASSRVIFLAHKDGSGIDNISIETRVAVHIRIGIVIKALRLGGLNVPSAAISLVNDLIHINLLLSRLVPSLA